MPGLVRNTGILLLVGSSMLQAQSSRPLRVAVGGEEPFVVDQGGTLSGIVAEIWRTIAVPTGWPFELQPFAYAPEAMGALRLRRRRGFRP